VAPTVHTRQREHRDGHHAVHQPANAPLHQLPAAQRRRFLARIRALDQLATLVREVPFGSGWAA